MSDGARAATRSVSSGTATAGRARSCGASPMVVDSDRLRNRRRSSVRYVRSWARPGVGVSSRYASSAVKRGVSCCDLGLRLASARVDARLDVARASGAPCACRSAPRPIRRAGGSSGTRGRPSRAPGLGGRSPAGGARRLSAGRIDPPPHDAPHARERAADDLEHAGSALFDDEAVVCAAEDDLDCTLQVHSTAWTVQVFQAYRGALDARPKGRQRAAQPLLDAALGHLLEWDAAAGSDRSIGNRRAPASALGDDLRLLESFQPWLPIRKAHTSACVFRHLRCLRLV